MKRFKNSKPRKRQRPWQSFHQQIKDKSLRKLRARREKAYGIWYGLAMVGILGWSVMIPLLIGLAIGLWIDATWVSPFPWSLLMLLIGVILGCLNAWYWVVKESRED